MKKTTTKKLSLKKETVRRLLGDSEAQEVVGGTGQTFTQHLCTETQTCATGNC